MTSDERDSSSITYPKSILSVFAGDLNMDRDRGGTAGAADNENMLFNSNTKKNYSGSIASSRNISMETKRLCDYLIDSYESEVSGDFLCACCYLWSSGNFDVFFDDDDVDMNMNLFNKTNAEGGRKIQISAEVDMEQRREKAEQTTETVLRSTRSISHNTQQSDKRSVIHQDTLVKFFYPFNVSIKETSAFGKAHFKNKFHPLETVDQMRKLLMNKFFLKFRKHCSAEKAPSDIRIYMCSSQGGKSSPSLEIKKTTSKKSMPMLVADICGDEDFICIESQYVTDICEGLKKQSPNNSKDANANDEVENHRPPSNAREMVDRLAHPPPAIHIKAAKPFPFAYGTVHAWGIATMVKYMKQVMELPQYEEHFLQYELNGYSFICLDRHTAAKVCAATDHRRQREQEEGEASGFDGEGGPAPLPSAGQVALHVAKLAFHAGLSRCY
jgi:hypothetical protein